MTGLSSTLVNGAGALVARRRRRLLAWVQHFRVMVDGAADGLGWLSSA
jgi:hypothetical protein